IDYHRVPDASGLHFWMRQHSKVYEFFSDQFVATAVQSYGVEESRRALERTQEFDERDLFENPTGEHGRAAWSEFHYWLRKMSAECHG
ncbi:hypothetical protein, partial [Streptococcus suis]|uniref:hypothetical protein n=1 Tax=Streptococcus suis TaxID=1307 RepID=UPI00370B830C